MNQEAILDVREYAPRERHPMIFESYDALAEGVSFDLVNDHDPKPVFYQLIHERDAAFRWQYLETGPEVWRVRITKAPKGTALEDGQREIHPEATHGSLEQVGYSCVDSTGEVPEAFKARTVPGGLELDSRPIFAAKQDPFGAIQEGVSRLKPGEELTLLVPFEPLPLYTVMEAKGFLRRTEQTDGLFKIRFARKP